MNRYRFFIDFDGTITTEDVVDAILERFGLPEWREAEAEWQNGRIGSRECLTRQIALLRSDRHELLEFARSLSVDAHFKSFVQTTRALGIPTAIVSDGLDLLIHEILKNLFKEEPATLEGIPIYCNQLIPSKMGFQIHFPKGSCEHACGNCKERVIRELTRPGETVIFVGDGLSDRFAARAAGMSFAKGKLLDYCQEEHIPHRSYSGFKDIEAWVMRRTGTVLAKE
jgi:2,3-diketo-5-methylthio-1-phosphopentane phosphatase